MKQLMLEVLVKFLTGSWEVLVLMSPYLLFGFLIAGLLSVWISPGLVERHLGGRGIWPVLKASLLGVPLPLCSCGVIPVAASLRRHGASKAATTAFLLSTPQTGVDSIAVTYALLGPVFAIFRPIAALVTGLIGGILVRIFGQADHSEAAAFAKPDAGTEAYSTNGDKGNKYVRGLRYGFHTLPRDIGLALLAGVLIAGAMSALVPEKSLVTYVGGGALSILLMMVVGVPIYVCATASVPIAAGAIHLGASPGAALAFLIAGPATNAAAFTTIWRVLGRKTAVLYLLTVAASAFGFGLLLDWVMPTANKAALQLAHQGHAGSHWYNYAAAAVLLTVLVFSRFRNHGAKTKEETTGMNNEHDHRQFRVTGMTCSHCQNSVQRALEECDGVETAEVSLETGQATVTGQHLDPEQLRQAITALGYKAEIINPK